jgi:hypothetical protein
MTVHKGKWTPEEDRRLLEMAARGKSWFLISANLKRPRNSVRSRVSVLKRKVNVPSTKPAEPSSPIIKDGMVGRSATFEPTNGLSEEGIG